ncbi:hypothetical protein ACN28S_40825 [Cystobacter fuscus]
MNGHLEAARTLLRPVAPVDRRQWVRALRQQDDLHVRPETGPRGSQRSSSPGGLKRVASLGDLTKLKK